MTAFPEQIHLCFRTDYQYLKYIKHITTFEMNVLRTIYSFFTLHVIYQMGSFFLFLFLKFVYCSINHKVIRLNR